MAMQEISDETRVIEPVGVVKPMPLDVPRVNGFRQGTSRPRPNGSWPT